MGPLLRREGFAVGRSREGWFVRVRLALGSNVPQKNGVQGLQWFSLYENTIHCSGHTPLTKGRSLSHRYRKERRSD
jgi:hypothetical protein